MRLAALSLAALLLSAGAALGQDDALAADREAGALVERQRARLTESLASASRGRLKRIAGDIGAFRAEARLEAWQQAVLAGERILPLLHEQLESPNGYAVRWSALALGEIGHKSSVKPLLSLHRDERTHAPDRFYALGALAWIGAEDELAALREIAFSDAHEALRRAAEIGWERAAGVPAMAAELGSIARGEVEERSAERATEVLGRLRLRQVGELAAGEALLDWAAAAPAAPEDAARWVMGDGYACWTDLDEDAARTRGIALVRFRRAVAKWLRPTRKLDWTTRWRLFRRKGDFDAYGATHEINFLNFPEFYYSYALREVVSFVDEDEERFARRLRHEASHDAIEHICGAVPPWLAEGICEALEVTPVSASGELSTPPTHEGWVWMLRQARSAGSLPSLEALAAMDGGAFYGPESNLHYACAWSFVHYLAVARGEQGHKVLHRAIQKLAERGPSDEAAEVLQQALRGDWSLARLEPGWRAYVAELTR